MFKGLWFFVTFSWKNDKRYLIDLVLGQIIGSLIPIVSVVMPKFIINELLGGRQIEKLLLYVAILIGSIFAGGAAAKWFELNVFTLRIKLANRFSLDLYGKMADSDLKRLEDPGFLDQKARAEKFLYGDWHGFSYLLESSVGSLGGILTVIGLVVVIATLNPWFVLLFIVLILAQSLVEGWAKRKNLFLGMERVQVERGWRYFGNLFEDSSTGKEVRMYGLRDWLLDHAARFGDHAVDSYQRGNNYTIRSELFKKAVVLIQQAATYGYLILRVLAGAITIGDFTMYTGAVVAFSGAMKGIVDNLVDIRQYGVYYNAVEEYLNVPSELRKRGSGAVPDQPHEIEFRGVSFKYPGQQEYALENANITLRAGTRYSIVGENGAGKTTFIKLLCRLYAPTEGIILLDGVDIAQIDYDRYMTLFTAVFQDFRLFSLSLKENVALSKSGHVSDAEIESLLHRVGLGKLIQRLPDGIHTQVNRNFDAAGFEPSGGEGQRIALARALFKDAPFVLLDEPTAALDPRAEAEIYEHFDTMVAGKTAVFVSHRLSSTRFCDVIFVFHNGRVVETGSHADLMRRDGLYAELYAMQSRYYID